MTVSAALLSATVAVGQTPTNSAWTARQDRAATPPLPGKGPLALLVRNPDTTRGEPPFVLLDQYGTVQRFVEPTPGVNLSQHVGKQVRIHHDTGQTLLATQLELPGGLQPLSGQPPAAGIPRGRLAPAQFDPPGRLASLATRERRFDVVPAQLNEETLDGFAEGADTLGDTLGDSAAAGLTGEGDTTPIVLEDVLAEEAEDALPSPTESTLRERLDPIPQGIDDGLYGEVHGAHSHATGVAHGADCPHCGEQHGAQYSSSPGGEPPCDCAKCRAARGTVGCPTCGSGRGWCGPSCDPPSRRGVYARAEYLLWWFDEMQTPPLVTVNGLGDAPDLGTAGSTVVYGGDLLDDPRSGLRLSAGMWFDNERDFALEGDLLFFETETAGFSTGDPLGAASIGRPFHNVNNLAPDAQLVSFPATVAGNVTVRARSEFESAGLRMRTGLCCRAIGGGACGGCASCQAGGAASLATGRPTAVSRVDFITGYRYAGLDESLLIGEDLTSLLTASPGSFDIVDNFDVDNEFHGVDFGFIYEWETTRWGVELMSKIALGNTHQRARINGSTTVSNGGASFTDTGGLLALPSNIGTYSRDRFSVLPELSARLSYRITPRVRVTAAYSLLYWANVLRPGDLIDTDLDENGIPPALAATALPRFHFHETALWAHGFNLGLDCSY